jgi:hypothetical protein
MQKSLVWIPLVVSCTGSGAPTAVVETTTALVAPKVPTAASSASDIVTDASAASTDSVSAIDASMAPSSMPTGSGDPSIVITLRRTECFGNCPNYKVTLRGDGTVVYEGNTFVNVRGRVVKHREPLVIATLAAKLDSMGYFSLAIPTHCDPIATDQPYAATSVSYKGQRRAINHYYGNYCIPKQLTKIEAEIDGAAGTKALVECPSRPCSR